MKTFRFNKGKSYAALQIPAWNWVYYVDLMWGCDYPSKRESCVKKNYSDYDDIQGWRLKWRSISVALGRHQL